MTDHEHIQMLISVYIDQELSEPERQEVEDHLVSCEECQRFYRDARNISSSLKSWSTESLSPDLEQKIASRIKAQPSREGRPMRKFKHFIPYNAMSTLIVCLLVLTVSLQVYLKRNVQTVLQEAQDAVPVAEETAPQDFKKSEGLADLPVEQNRPARFSQKSEKRQAVMGVSSDEKIPDRDINKTKQLVKKDRPDLTGMETTGDEAGGETNGRTAIDSLSKIRSQTSSRHSPEGAFSGTEMVFKGQSMPGEASPPSILLAGKAAEIREKAEAQSAAPVTTRFGSVSDGYSGEIYTYTDKGLAPMRPGLMIVKPDQAWEEPYPEPYPYYSGREEADTEEYDRVYENEFLSVLENPLSTFSIDVDTASYANVRRYLNNGRMPPKDAVRIEEMVNYFVYDYPQPDGEEPFSVITETASCPWNPDHQLALIGIKAKELSGPDMPPGNLVFLIDVSGSMNRPEKLELLKSALRLMVERLRAEERISIVTYAGQAGLVLDSTPGYEKDRILQAIDRLQAGGSTAGEQGIQLAYRIARQNFIPQGNNRVILATDGDFNVGVSSAGELTRVIEEKRGEGVFLTVLGFGTGNYKDAKMEKLADKGNGNYYYIDTLQEAQKVLGSELGSVLFPVAKDVKIQVEFNPSAVKAYRLIGYENRTMAKEDFNDDTKDAGELGAGHTVTAFYEVVPAGSQETHRKTDPLKYMQTVVQESGDLMTVKLRYKELQHSTSQLITRVVPARQLVDGDEAEVSDHFRFGAAVAEFGLLLRDSAYKGQASYLDVLHRAKASLESDAWGYRQEFIRLVEKAAVLDRGY